jgi:phosphatidylinositol 4-kinase
VWNFQAQDAFIRSLAAYSLILYLVQIKDRHNGNIMFDDAGHIIHIGRDFAAHIFTSIFIHCSKDFGFILDIAPGGIEFEASPFKLTTEMISIMDGDSSTPAYKLFSELIVKSYLAVRYGLNWVDDFLNHTSFFCLTNAWIYRPYAEEIVQMVALMLDSGLPCFKGMTLI